MLNEGVRFAERRELAEHLGEQRYENLVAPVAVYGLASAVAAATSGGPPWLEGPHAIKRLRRR